MFFENETHSWEEYTKDSEAKWEVSKRNLSFVLTRNFDSIDPTVSLEGELIDLWERDNTWDVER